MSYKLVYNLKKLFFKICEFSLFPCKYDYHSRMEVYYLGEKHRNSPRDNDTFRLRDADNLEIGVRGTLYDFFGGGTLVYIWQNNHFGPSTITRGSVSSLNFRNGRFSPQTLLLCSNSS